MFRPNPWKAAVTLILACALVTPAFSSETESGFNARVDELVEAGHLSGEQSLLVRFQRVFAANELPNTLRQDSAVPTKSITMLIDEFERLRPALSTPVSSLIDGYLARSSSDATYETANFRISYDLGGPNAVPAADLDVSGVPDFVERIGGFAEQALAAYVGAGFDSPPTANGRVEISFREMEAFGFAQVFDGVPHLVLHRNFEGFPQNSDPAGSAIGAAKVTVAHELKHASQYAATGWTEEGWLEADAVWAEEFVFGEVNDYVRYLADGSPISAPNDWLPASYGDCLWQHLLVERHGVDVLVDFFARRADAPGEDPVASFAHVLQAHGSSLRAEARELGIWSYFAGANSGNRPYGWAEADLYPTPPYGAHVDEPSATRSGRLRGMQTEYLLVPAAGRTGQPSLAFAGVNTDSYTVTAVALTATGQRWAANIDVNSSGVSQALPVAWEDLVLLAVAVTNVTDAATENEWFVTIDDDNAVSVNEQSLGAGLTLAPNRPNPFRATTSIAFNLPQNGNVRLTIYDVAGRLVRRLIDGQSLPAGTHEARWQGDDEVGRAAAPGVYYYRLEAGERSISRHMLLIR